MTGKWLYAANGSQLLWKRDPGGREECDDGNADDGDGCSVPACWKMRVPQCVVAHTEAEPKPFWSLSWSFGRALRCRGAFRRLGRCRLTQKVTFLDPPEGGQVQMFKREGLEWSLSIVIGTPAPQLETGFGSAVAFIIREWLAVGTPRPMRERVGLRCTS